VRGSLVCRNCGERKPKAWGYYCSRPECKKARMKTYGTRKPVGKEGATEGDRMTISQAEAMYGFSAGALSGWLKRHKLWGRTRKEGKYRYISINLLERYEAATARVNVERLPERPSGYVGVYKAADMLSASTNLVWQAVKRGQVHAVRVGYINYYRKSDLERLAMELKDKPLPGWEAIRDRCKRLGADRTACTDWLRNHGYEVRKFRAPDKQVTLYALTKDLDTWQARFTGHCRSLSMEQARDIRRRKARGERRCDLAKEYGVDENVIRQIVRGETYREPELERAA
jgi:hypothetical protein